MTSNVTLGASEGRDLAVVIVNYRTGSLVVNCLASLAVEVAANVNANVRVLIVDNASNDGSDLVIQQAIDDRGWANWARLIRSSVNGGFAYGNNLAIRKVFADYGDQRKSDRALIWMLNPDTLVRPGAIGQILRFMRSHPSAGAIGTAIEDDTGELWPYAFRFHSLAGEIESAFRSAVVTWMLGRHALAKTMARRPEQVDWVSGASVVLRGAVIRTAGWFDEGFFLYFEETDFFHRVAQAGWDRWYVPGARIQHISGQSTGLTSRDAALRRIPAYWFNSRRRYLIKNHGRLYAAAADVITLAGLLTWRVRCAVMHRPHGGSPYFVRDFLRHSSMFRRDIDANPGLLVRSEPVTQPAPSIVHIAQSV